MSSRSKGGRRRNRRTSRDVQRHVRVASLRTTAKRFVVSVIVDVHALGSEETAQLYWAIRALGPVVADVEEPQLIAHFVRNAPTADVAAWAVADEVRALPQAVLLQVEAGRLGQDGPDLILATVEPTDRVWRQRAA